MKLVIVESPFGNPDLEVVRRNILYARFCIQDSLVRGEGPWCSHLFYTQPHILDDNKPKDRERGMEAGFAWGNQASLRAVYKDFGVSKGMEEGIARAKEIGQPTEDRRLPDSLMGLFRARLADDGMVLKRVAKRYSLTVEESLSVDDLEKAFSNVFDELRLPKLWRLWV